MVRQGGLRHRLGPPRVLHHVRQKHGFGLVLARGERHDANHLSDVNCDPVSSGGAVEVAFVLFLLPPNSPIAREGRERRPERAADSARADG